MFYLNSRLSFSKSQTYLVFKAQDAECQCKRSERVSVTDSESLCLKKSKIAVSGKSWSHYFWNFAVSKILGLKETKKLSLKKVSISTISIEKFWSLLNSEKKASCGWAEPSSANLRLRLDNCFIKDYHLYKIHQSSDNWFRVQYTFNELVQIDPQGAKFW